MRRAPTSGPAVATGMELGPRVVVEGLLALVGLVSVVGGICAVATWGVVRLVSVALS